MADAVTSQTLVEGSRKLVMKFTNISDGTGEAAVRKVDVSALTPAASDVKITKIQYTTSGMSVQLLWDATANVLAYALAADQTGELDFSSVGGLINNAGTGVTGDLLLTTVGHSSGDFYSIIIEMDKR